MIDADAFDKVLNEAQIKCKRNGGNFRYGVLNNVRANLAKAPTVNGWISVKDRLPNDAGKYLVTIKSNFTDTKYIVKTAWFLNDLYDNWQFRYEGISKHSPGFYNGDGEGDWIENVAYWMPLPSTEGLNET